MFHIEMAKRLLQETQEELQSARQPSSGGGLLGFLGKGAEDPRVDQYHKELLIVREELESKIQENEMLVMSLSESRKQLEIMTERRSFFESEVSKLSSDLDISKDALRFRTDAEQGFRDESNRLSIELAAKEQEGQKLKASLDKERQLKEDLEFSTHTLRKELNDKKLLSADLQEQVDALTNERTLLEASYQAIRIAKDSAEHSAQLSSASEVSLAKQLEDLELTVEVLKASGGISKDSSSKTNETISRNVAQLLKQADWYEARHGELSMELSVAASAVAREKIERKMLADQLSAIEAQKVAVTSELATTRNACESQITLLTENLCIFKSQLTEYENRQNSCSHCGAIAKCEFAICSDCHGGGVLTRTIFQ